MPTDQTSIFQQLKFVSLLAFALCNSAFAEKPYAQRLFAIDFIHQSFKTRYAPLEWKQKEFGWDLEKEIAGAKSQLHESLTDEDFQKIVSSLLQSPLDYHVKARFYATEQAMLPFSIKSAEGRYFFSSIEQDDFPFEVGDELISMDDTPIAKIINALKPKRQNHGPTDQELAEITLTNRKASLGDEIPSSLVILTGIKKGEAKLTRCVLSWDYVPELIKKGHSRLLAQTNELIPSKRGYFPFLGAPIWQAPSHHTFFAYLFSFPLGKQVATIGFIRIPTYSFENSEKAVQDFALAIDTFQRRADLLVIDQTDNSGGSILTMYSLLSMLTDLPLDVLRHDVCLNEADVYLSYKQWAVFDGIQSDEKAKATLGRAFEGYPVSSSFVAAMQERNRLLIQEWQKGQMFIPGFLYGISSITPHPQIRFSKPILCLIDPLDMSCGDFFPAILQDNQRAILMGQQTAGAGGFVNRIEFPCQNSIKHIDLTASMAKRKSGEYIENNGIKPDVEYIPTVIDLQNNYVEYTQAIFKLLKEMI